ncbi:MAG: DUF6446 family protein [Silicimonas sp.]|jgi:hypothetical protein|nr:DUF6446 family protein [Silicimonas sp.]
MGKFLTVFLVVSAVLAGVGMYYLQVYAFYETVEPTNVSDVQLTGLASGEPEVILYENFRAIDAESSPLRYRACFDTSMSEALLTETFVIYDNPVPNVAPGWFDCFDAKALGAALEAGKATAYLGIANVHYGFDRVVAIDGEGRGFAWHQINACGEAAFDGDPVPEGCPPPPARDE